MKKGIVIHMIPITPTLGSVRASERYFTDTYEPETMPAGAADFEYGVTDNYSVSLYLNTKAVGF